MKYLDLIVEMILFYLLVSVCNLEFSSIRTLYEKTENLRRKYESKNFISESFENTCKGKGFSDLNQWQKTCGAMWKLDYIGWCDAEDFMVVQQSDKGRLYYGRWIGPDGNGEVYCRR